MGSTPHPLEMPDERWLVIFAFIGVYAALMIAAAIVDKACTALGRLMMGRIKW